VIHGTLQAVPAFVGERVSSGLFQGGFVDCPKWFRDRANRLVWARVGTTNISFGDEGAERSGLSRNEHCAGLRQVRRAWRRAVFQAVRNAQHARMAVKIGCLAPLVALR
jgi:hypothetical protein